MNRDSEGNLPTGGVVWERFHHFDTDIPQVVGHTKGRFMENNGGSFNPQWRKNALNINTIRDYQKNLSPVAAAIEDQENLEIFKFDRLNR